MILRIACWNLNGCLKKPRQRWKILNLLRLANADVYCLQEVMRLQDLKWLAKQLECSFTDGLDQQSSSAKPRPSAACYKGIVKIPDKQETKKSTKNPAWHKGGMCVLSRYPVLKTQVFPLVHSYCNALVGMEIQIRDVAVWVYSIHLDSRDYLKCEDRRLQELKTILQWLPPQNIILAGDWNSVDDATLASRNCSEKKCALPSKLNQNLPANLLLEAGFQDVHAQLNMEEPTWLPSTKERIDRIYTSQGLKPIAATTIGNGIAKWPTGKDHCMILADVEVAARFNK